MTFELTILGTNAAVPFKNRYLSGQVLNIKENLFLIDCGEGTQFRINDLGIKKSKINQIFISHLHGDHVFGLIGVLTSMAMEGRKEPLDIFAPTGLEEMITVQFKHTYYVSPFPIRFHVIDTEKHQLIFENNIVSVLTLPLLHRVPAAGYLFVEKENSRSMIAEKIAAHNIPFSLIKGIKNGDDFIDTEGVRIPNAELTLPPPKPRKFAYCSDTRYNEALLPYLEGVDMLYHETTFLDDMAEQATITGHSTALQAATLAKKAQVKTLITGHYSSRYIDLSVILAEAKSVFDNTVLGIDGEKYSVIYSQ